MAERIPIASDHAGFELKERLRVTLADLGFDVEDIGTHSTASSDYADFAHPLAEEVSSGEVKRGVLLCGTGLGMSYVANAGYMRYDDWANNINHRGDRVDWDGSGTADALDIPLARATGVFWRNQGNSVITFSDGGAVMTLDFITEADGTGNTYLISENLQAGKWVDPSNSYLPNTSTGALGFGIYVTAAASTDPW